MTRSLCIAKVGGSLLDRPDLPDRLLTWRERQSHDLVLFLLGGGEFCELIRQWQPRFGFSDEAAHHLCLSLLGTTGQLLAAMLPTAEPIVDWTVLRDRQWKSDTTVAVLLPQAFLTEEPNLAGDALPIGWDSTTDSIAARLAVATEAEELVLLKSSLPAEFDQLAELSDREYIDRYFPWAVKPLGEVRLVNMADAHFPDVVVFE